jgi:hypothetical protein
MSGGASVLLGFLALWLNPHHYKVVLYVVTALCASYAMYEVWANERNDRLTLLDKLAKPDLKIDIHRCYRSPDGTKLLLEVGVVNASEVDVTVRGTMLEVLHDGDVYPSQGRLLVDGEEHQFRIELINANRERVLQPRRLTDLFKETCSHALTRGVHKAGELVFYFGELPEMERSIRLRLTFTDAFLQHHTIEQNVPYLQNVWLD